MQIVQRVAAKAVIVKNGKILILRIADSYREKSQQGKYHIPGGRIEPGEHFEQALKREVQEETGLKVTVDRPICVFEWSPLIKGVKHQIIGIFFVCTSKDDRIVLAPEHDEYHWIEPDTYTDFNLADPYDRVIAEYIKLRTDYSKR